MSVLETPRLYFKGEISWDPIVTNNYGPPPSPVYEYDETNCETVLPDGSNGEHTGSKLLADTESHVQAFRKDAIKTISQIGNWNVDGTHRSTFYNTCITGCDLGSGLVTDDPVVSLPVNFTGMLVDLEPYGAWSSQLFFDTFRIGVDGGYRILAPRSARFIARGINFSRNSANQMIAGVASVVWQTSFPKGGLRLTCFDSKALLALSQALESPDVLGLTVRFNSYRTIYFDDPALRNSLPSRGTAFEELQKKLEQGGFQPNPARSQLVGVIGLWRRGEPMQEPGERALTYAPGSPVGTAHALVNATSLMLDLSNSVMEISDDLRKMDLGPLQVKATTANGPTPVARLTYEQYNRAAYEATAGIVTVPLTPGREKLAAAGPLSLWVGGITLLSEQPYRASAQIPNLYIDEGGTALASFQVVQNGVAITSSVPLTMYTLDANGNVLSSAALTSDANGVVTFPVPTQTPGITLFVPSFNGQNDNPSGGAFDPQVNTYMYVRVLPADQATGELPPTWANVYATVLANWNAMAPCMDNWLRLNDAAQIKSLAPILKKLTDPAVFEHFRYMPVTRDLTAGARALLYRFLDAPETAPLAAAAATTAGTAHRPPATSAPPLTEAARRSQSMRRPMDKA